MMTYDIFLKISKLMYKESKKTNTLYKMGIDTINFIEPYDRIICMLISEIYGKDGYDWWSWFIYDNDFGEKISKESPGAWDDNNSPICYDFPSLYEYLENLKNQK